MKQRQNGTQKHVGKEYISDAKYRYVRHNGNYDVTLRGLVVYWNPKGSDV